jgi:AcrR family transcriptional regulator
MSNTPSGYSSNLRDRQKAATRDEILRAVGRRLETTSLEDLSFAEIAQEAGVGERTVYRHFPTKEALLGAFWAWMQTQAVVRPAPSRRAQTGRRGWLVEGSVALLVDTVGFIRDLPAELEGAFRATLEEVREARALLLVADAADPHLEEQVASVRRILSEWDLDDRPVLLLLNQADRVRDPALLQRLAEDLGGVPCCAKDPETLGPIRRRIGALLGQRTG